jgi:hypothetical protein
MEEVWLHASPDIALQAEVAVVEGCFSFLFELTSSKPSQNSRVNKIFS